MAAVTPGPSPDIEAWRALQTRLRQAGQRRLVLLEGDRARALAWLSRLLPVLSTSPGIWSGPGGESPSEALHTIAPVEGRRWLGRELAVVVWDGWRGNPPDSLAALSGTLVAGGLLFWLMPPLADWGRLDDPDYQRTGLQHPGEHPFARRLAGILAADTSVIRIAPASNPRPALPAVEVPAKPFRVATTADQQTLVAEVVHLGQGRRRRPLVVTADRGRGKSAALGMAAVELLRGGRRHIAVTAPSKEAVATLFYHARIAAGQPANPDMPVTDVMLADGARLVFWPVDQLLAQQPEAELVLVDEAAAIPAPLLQQVLLGWPRVAFATTVHGYEGSGRGFALRFRSVLERETPHWRSLSLSTPIRWAEADPLEPLTRRLFLLDAEPPGLADLPGDGPVTAEPWAPGLATEQELGEAFGLLVNAHYRTSPADLRQWMDDPEVVSWRVRVAGRLAGVLWATVEGGLEPALAEQVMLGRRRLRGHLLPQSLASHSGFAEAAGLRILRVVRVAVSAEARRRGQGGRLVAAAADHARQQGLDAIGTSFGGSPELVRFWQRAGWHLVRVGLQREASSGEYPVQMLAGVSHGGEQLATRLNRRFGEHWLTLVPATWPELPPELLLVLTACLPDADALSEDDLRDLRSFAEGHRGFELALPVLRRLSRQPGVAGVIASRPEASLWCRAVLQGWSWPRLQAAGECVGRRQGEDRLRAVARTAMPRVMGERAQTIMQNRPDL